jgi:hypothetical protein
MFANGQPLSIDPLIAEAKRRAQHRRLAGTVLLAVALAAVAALFALRSTTPGGASRAGSSGGLGVHQSHSGEVVGSIRWVGGLYVPREGKSGGLVTVYNARGRVIRRITVHTGSDFRLHLAPGRYRLGYGGHPRSLWGCPRPTIVTIRPGRTTHQDLPLGCDYY